MLRYHTGTHLPIVRGAETRLTPDTGLPIVRSMTQDELVESVRSELSGTEVVIATEEGGAPPGVLGRHFLLLRPGWSHRSVETSPNPTIVVNDYPGFDESSDLGREGVFRVNAWVSRQTFDRVTPDEGSPIDYSVLDRIIPHPIYAKQAWVSVLNPGALTGEAVEDLLTEAHARDRARYEKRRASE